MNLLPLSTMQSNVLELTVFAVQKIVLHQFLALEVAKMVDEARSLATDQHNIFFVGLFCCRWLHKIFFGLSFFWLKTSFLMHSTFWIVKLVQRKKLDNFTECVLLSGGGVL